MVSWWSFLRFSARAMCQSSPTWPLTTCPMTIWWNTFSKKKHFKNCSSLWSKPSSDNQLRHQRQHIISTPDQPSYQVFVFLQQKIYMFLFFYLEKNKFSILFLVSIKHEPLLNIVQINFTERVWQHRNSSFMSTGFEGGTLQQQLPEFNSKERN